MFKVTIPKLNYSNSKIFFSKKNSPIIIFNEISSQKIQKAQKSSKSPKSSDKPPSSSSPSGDVPGLSSKVLAVPTTEVGPGASKKGEYKNPEYFSYNWASFFEAEIELSKYRCPQPSAKAKPLS